MCAGNCLLVKAGGLVRRSFRRSMGGACGPAERSCARCSRLFLFAGLTPQAVALELDAMSIVNDAIQYRIAEGWIGNDIMPLRYGHLTRDQQRSLVVAIVDDLKQITALVGGERFGSPVVKDEEIDAWLERAAGISWSCTCQAPPPISGLPAACPAASFQKRFPPAQSVAALAQLLNSASPSPATSDPQT